MQRERLTWLRLGAVALDATALIGAWMATVHARSVLPALWPLDLVPQTEVLRPLEPALVLPLGWLIVPLWLLALTWRGSYLALRRKTAATVLAEITAGATAAAVAATALVFLARLPLNRTLLLGFALASIPALLGSRALQSAVLRALRRRSFDPYRVVVLGTADAARPLVAVLTARREWGMVVHSQLAPADAGRLPDLLVAEPIDEVFVAGSWPPDHLVEVARSCDELGVPLSLDATFLGLRADRVALQEIDGWTALTFRAEGPTLERIAKRVLDITVASVGLLLVGPVLAALALAIRRSDGGSPWFVQERVGQFGRPFPMLKLRTMEVGAELRQAELAAHNQIDGPAFKLARDPRVTPLGRWLRRLSVDELPQLLNVLRGDMSLVGPRPPLPSEVARYERWQLRRLSVRPGMTGLWQVSGRSDLPFDAWMALDLQYIDRWSLWLDLTLLARTIPAVLRGTGAR